MTETEETSGYRCVEEMSQQNRVNTATPNPFRSVKVYQVSREALCVRERIQVSGDIYGSAGPPVGDNNVN